MCEFVLDCQMCMRVWHARGGRIILFQVKPPRMEATRPRARAARGGFGLSGCPGLPHADQGRLLYS